ncbi:MAG: class I SAM-dependent methyltransferase [Actinomycetota bacterium]
MDRTGADLRAYYEQEAVERTRKSPSGQRVAIRDRFTRLLVAEGRTRVVDFGSGPGGDSTGFAAIGVEYVGIDLAHGNAVLAAEAGVTVIQGTVDAPPFRDGSFDAGWSMSTLMHLPEDQVADALAAMARALAPGSPLQIGLWGGDRQDVVMPSKTGTEQRLFSYRPFDRNWDLFAAIGGIEWATRWDIVPGGSENGLQYQVFLIRLPAPAPAPGPVR